MNDPAPLKQKKHGCFFYGCLTSLVLLVVAGIAIFFAVRFALHQADAIIVQYTDTTPMTIQKVVMPDADLQALHARVDAFTAAMNAHHNPPPLELNGAEITTLLTNTPQMQPFKDSISIALDGDEIKAQLSLPLDAVAVQIPALKTLDVSGRYLNGNGTFKASIVDGKLSVFTQSLTVKGQPVPESVMVTLRQQNLADGFNRGVNPSPFAQYESIQVKDGMAIITPKPN